MAETYSSPSLQRAPAHAGTGGMAAAAADPALAPLLLAPAYIALAIAIGSAILSLSTLFSIADYTAKLWLAFAIALIASFCMQSGGRVACDMAVWVLALLFASLAPLLVFVNSASFFPPVVYEDSNAMVAVGMGWLIILTVVVAGAQIGRIPVALTAPLVPALSLFGLLNIMSLDPSANLRFLVFIAAALYLTAYERLFLGPIRARQRMAAAAGNAAMAAWDERPAQWGNGRQRQALGATPAGRLAGVSTQLLTACALWLAAFVAGGSLLYWPISVAVPTRLSLALSRTPLGTQPQVSDWRDSKPIVELRGGRYPLSTRTIARVTVTRGQPSGLWRTNIYQSYKGSRWLESNELGVASVFARKGSLTAMSQATNAFSFSPFARPFNRETNLNRNQCEDDSCRRVLERVEPSSNATANVLSSGEPVYVEGDLGELQVRSDITVGINDANKRGEPYSVSSQVLVPDLPKLLNAPGLTKEQMRAWLEDPMVLETLNLPDDPHQALQIRAYAKRIVDQARKTGRKLDSPTRKVNAVADFLVSNCVYSLNSPPVPEGRDAVLYFLRTSKRGACDMFASSMVLLLRAMEVPSRLVTGYIQPDTADNAEGTVFTLRERDAHAWVEYYVPGTGWVSVDPTQGTRDVDGADTLSWLDVRNLPALMGNFFLPFTGALLAAALVLIGSGMKQQRLQRLSPQERQRLLINDLYRASRSVVARQVPHYEHQTPHEYEAAVMSSPLSPAAKLEFGALTYLFVQSQYGAVRTEIDPGEAHESLRRLRRALRTRGRAQAFTIPRPLRGALERP